MRCLELFSGIGGFSAACPDDWNVVQAFDISQPANAVYACNAPHPVAAVTLESIGVEELRGFAADLWWMSPPCQPFTSRGRQRDLHDPRCAALLNLIAACARIRPDFLLLENVPQFRRSLAADQLRTMLNSAGYHLCEAEICPTRLGIANRRLRYYLIASRRHPVNVELPATDPVTGDSTAVAPELQRRIADVLIESDWSDARLQIPSRMLEQYRTSLHWVEPDRFPDSLSTCFTAAYGQSPVFSGSYLRRGDQSRYFSPLEIVRLLGFDRRFRFPSSLSLRKCWSLAGNSLNIDVVRRLMTALKAST